MRIHWDESKRQFVLEQRKIDFKQLENLLLLPYLEDQRVDNAEQYRIIGFARGILTTFVVEYRMDELGSYLWVVTAWKATRQEKRSYEEATG
jgi:uncharacterized DUF497 family protein